MHPQTFMQQSAPTGANLTLSLSRLRFAQSGQRANLTVFLKKITFHLLHFGDIFGGFKFDSFTL